MYVSCIARGLEYIPYFNIHITSKVGCFDKPSCTSNRKTNTKKNIYIIYVQINQPKFLVFSKYLTFKSNFHSIERIELLKYLFIK